MAAAAAALQGVVAANPVMDAYLENTLGVVTLGVRGNIINNGHRDPAVLATKEKDYVKSLCLNVRENGLGNALQRNPSVEVEENLKKFQLWCTFRSLCQRPLLYADANMASLDTLWEYMELLPDNPDPSSLSNFADKSDKRAWFESIINHLKLTKGSSGLPLYYVIRPDTAPPAVDPGYGQPDFATELYTRGRHDGTWHRADRLAVWNLLFGLCHGR